MTSISTKKARIISISPAGLKAILDEKLGFIRRRDIDWENPCFDLHNHFSVGQEVDVSILGENRDKHNELILSIKHASYDPWGEFINKYRCLSKNDETLIVTGVIRDVHPKEVYIELEDHNDALLRKNDLEELEKYKNMELSDIFAVGDYVRGVVKKVEEDGRLIELSISQYITHLFKKYRPNEIKTTLKDIYGDKLEALRRRIESTINDEHISVTEVPPILTADGVFVFIIDNEQKQIDLLKKSFTDIGVKSKYFLFTKESANDLEFNLSDIIKTYTCVFIDKNLGEDSGTKYASSILKNNPTFPVIIITGEHPYQARERLKKANLQGRVYLLVRPYLSEEILNSLDWARKGYEERRYILNEMNLNDSIAFVSPDYNEEDKMIEENLVNFCGVRDNKVVILEMNPITLEITLVYSKGLDDKDWSRYKTTLRHTPIFETIKLRRPQHFAIIPEERKRHLPEELKTAVSMIGVPLKVFGDISYGLFVFGMEQTFTYLEYKDIINNARELSFHLERFLFKQKMIMDLRFRTMGVMYSAMRHDLIGLMDGLSSFDLVEEWDIMKERIMLPGTDGEKTRTAFRNSIKNVKNTIRELRNLLEHYAVMDKKDEEKKYVNIKELIEDVIKIIRVSGEEKIDIDIVDNSGGSDNAVLAVRTRLRQIMSNVVLNACQQITHGELPVKKVVVELFVDKEDSSKPVKVFVRDTGPGIHKKDFERIFNPLYTTRKGGMGLGLHLCKAFLTEIGGGIRVIESYILGGSTFEIELPRRCR